MKTATVRKVGKGTSSGMEFILASKRYYDKQSRDYLYCVCFTDPCDEIAVFTRAGYSDDEILAVLDSVRELVNPYDTVILPRPVKVKITE